MEQKTKIEDTKYKMEIDDTTLKENEMSLLEEEDKHEEPEKDAKRERLIQLQTYDRKQTYREIVQVHEAADTAKKAYERRYQSEEENQSEKPTFAQDEKKLINNYTNKVSLQMKYQTIHADDDVAPVAINDD